MAHVYDDWDADEVAGLYIDQDYTRAELAREYDVSPSTVGRFLREEGIYKTAVMDDAEIESKIRAALAHIVNPELARELPIARVEGERWTWIVNDYMPKEGNHDFPIEVQIRYNARKNTLTVIENEFTLRGKSRRDLQTLMNNWLD